MPVTGATKRYLIKSGAKVVLDKIASNDKSLFSGDNKADVDPQFLELQKQLQEQQKLLYAQNAHRLLVVIQAMDTGGKDGCIKNVFSSIDPQGLRVCSFKKPTEEELAHDFLWRIHSKVPKRGEIVIFNRSHYEDVIAVRVKKIFSDAVWKRRTNQIIDFERMLAEEGTTIVKIFLHISKDEQKRRLESRLANPEKHWKLNPDDLSDRALWDHFMKAYGDVISQTSSDVAPWYVVPADRKWYRNLCVARIVLDTMKGLKMRMPDPAWNPKEIVIGE